MHCYCEDGAQISLCVVAAVGPRSSALLFGGISLWMNELPVRHSSTLSPPGQRHVGDFKNLKSHQPR